jgi:hypothetical protein
MTKLLLKEPVTKLEKWLNRLVTIALAAWQIIQFIIANPIK